MTRTDVPLMREADAPLEMRRAAAHVRLLRAIYGPDETIDLDGQQFMEDSTSQEQT
jgi:hypothetical protein